MATGRMQNARHTGCFRRASLSVRYWRYMAKAAISATGIRTKTVIDFEMRYAVARDMSARAVRIIP
jgi:hypothetical protein